MSPRKVAPPPWPWQADTPLERARRVAQFYRQALATTDRKVCEQVDELARRLGQSWAVPTVQH